MTPRRTMAPRRTLVPGATVILCAAVALQGVAAPRAAGTDRAPSEGTSSGGPARPIHWAFRPLEEVAAPGVSDNGWAQTPIDRFVFQRLAEKGLTPSPPADARTLARRLHFDLIGLPPTPEAVDAFVEDLAAATSPAARARRIEALVEELLASPRHGERWGRHWLDVVRYADSNGQEADDDRPYAYRYRDFIIRAFNDDLPYDTFVRWQLAGDEYEPERPRAVLATGFLVAGPNTELGDTFLEEERLRNRYNELDDMVSTIGSALLGLTIGCARCHDHKFDPIPSRDYYSLLAAVHSGDRSEALLGSHVELEDYRRRKEAWDVEVRGATERLERWKKENRKENAEKQGGGAADEDPEGKAALEAALRAIQGREPPSPPRGLVFRDFGPEPRTTWLFHRGDFRDRSEPVSLGFVQALTSGKSPADYLDEARAVANVSSTTRPVSSTLQRRALAEWVTDVEHGAGALLARVIVNRLWQHHFGEGLVRSVSDFGAQGEVPTHPELLEWLARDLVSHGWSLRRLHRLITASAVYQQSSASDPGRARIDPENRLLWRHRPQRLEAEAFRDTMLAVSGVLNLEAGGPAFKPPIPAEAMVARNLKNPYPSDTVDSPAVRRRSVYMFHKRVVPHPMLQVFDRPDALQSCGRRETTTVATQALALLNDPAVRDLASAFAARLRAEGGAEPQGWVRRGYRLALSRAPSESERAAALAFLDGQARARAAVSPAGSRAGSRAATPAGDGKRTVEESVHETLVDFCQALLCLNELLYID